MKLKIVITDEKNGIILEIPEEFLIESLEKLLKDGKTISEAINIIKQELKEATHGT